MRLASALVLALIIPSAAFAQVTGTSLKSKGTLTAGQITPTSVFYVDGSHNVKGVIPSELSKLVLSNMSVTSGSSSVFTLTVGSLSITGLQTTTGVLTLSNAAIGNATPTNAAAILVNTTISGREGIRIQSVASQAQPWLSFYDSSNTNHAYFDPVYGLQIRHASTTNRMAVGTAGSAAWALNSSNTSSYQQIYNTAGIAFAAGAWITGTSISVNSQTANILQVTDTGYARSTAISIGGLLTGMSAITSSASLTIGNTAITATGVITATLPDGATGTSGRVIFVQNIGAGNVTVASFTTGQTIDGSGTVTLSGGSGGMFIYNGSTWNRFKMQ